MTESKATAARPRASGDPSIAVLLTWIVPGAGHVSIGRFGTAIACFVAVEGLYWLGVVLSDGMFLEYLPPEMRSTFAAALTPEVGNLGALFLHYKTYGYGPGQPRAWPPLMDLGTACTAMSGVLNLFVMAAAHHDARARDASPRGDAGAREIARGGLHPSVAALLAWLVPGLGYLVQGRRLRAAISAAMLIGLFLLGTLLAEGSNLDRERHFYYWSGQFLLGLPAMIAELVHGHAPVTGEIPYADGGVVIACLAGMLNVLCMLDAYGWSDDRRLAPERAADVAAEVRVG